jgi:putative addiction module component (TIGR02574 family)
VVSAWDYQQRVDDGDFGDARFVSTRQLRESLAEVLNRVAYGGEQVVVTRHGRPFVAIVATYDLQACQALEDRGDVAEVERMDAGGLAGESAALDIDKLAPDERLRLIEQLWESLREHPEAVPVTAAQRAELDRRLNELDAGEAEAVSWHEVKRRIQSRLA